MDFRKLAPYLGIGCSNVFNTERGWSFGTDLGAFYQGSARVSLRSVNCMVPSALCQRLAGDVSDYKVYPVLRASLVYSF